MAQDFMSSAEKSYAKNAISLQGGCLICNILSFVFKHWLLGD